MNLIEYKYSYHSWGFNEEELHRIDMVKKEYTHFDHGKLDASMPLPDDLIDTISSFFEGLFAEGFPKDVMAWDAPMWSLTIDDKKCTRIALVHHDHLFGTLSSVFNKMKEVVTK
jgi:hypothetical protein